MLGPTCRYLQWSVFFFRGCNCNGCNCNGCNMSWRCLVALSQWCNVVLSEIGHAQTLWFIIFQKCHPFGGVAHFADVQAHTVFRVSRWDLWGKHQNSLANGPLIPSDAWLNRGLPGPRQEQCGPLPQLSSGLADPETGAQDQWCFIWRKFKDFNILSWIWMDLDVGFGPTRGGMTIE